MYCASCIYRHVRFLFDSGGHVSIAFIFFRFVSFFVYCVCVSVTTIKRVTTETKSTYSCAHTHIHTWPKVFFFYIIYCNYITYTWWDLFNGMHYAVAYVCDGWVKKEAKATMPMFCLVDNGSYYLTAATIVTYIFDAILFRLGVIFEVSLNFRLDLHFNVHAFQSHTRVCIRIARTETTQTHMWIVCICTLHSSPWFMMPKKQKTTKNLIVDRNNTPSTIWYECMWIIISAAGFKCAV